MVGDEFFLKSAQTFLALTLQGRRQPLQKGISGLTMGEKGMLLCLSEHPQGMTAGEIGRQMQIGSGGVANALNNLERKGYVSRAMSPTDRRSVVATISPQGSALIEDVKQSMLRATTAFLRELGENDTRELLRIFRRLLEITDTCGICPATGLGKEQATHADGKG